MKVSIIITNYNKEKYIEKCILSVLDQDSKNIEIIVLDNSSTDNSLNIINKFSEKILIKQKNRISKFAAYNQIDLIIDSFKMSSGDIICLLDGDDFFLPNKISTIKKYFTNNPGTTIIFDTPRVLINSKIVPLKLKNSIFNNVWSSTVPTSGISFKRDYFNFCLKTDLLRNFPLIEIDFRLNFFSKKIDNKYVVLKEYLTFYRKVEDGIMSKIKKFSKKWWVKRLEAHYFIKEVYIANSIKYNENYDFYLTKLIVQLLKKKTN